MPSFWFIVNAQRKDAVQMESQARAFLRARGCALAKCAADADIVVSIGGDGTVVRAHRAAKKPILAVNAGTLGYLTRVEPDDLTKALDAICAGAYTLEKRMTLTCDFQSGREWNALNDIAILKRAQSVIRFSLTVDDVPLTRYTADGLIVATPTGSTGYSLSAGGPIMDPNGRQIVLTPLAPHTLINRPIVLSETSVILLKADTDAIVAVDGESHALPAGTPLTVRTSAQDVRFVSFGRESFIERLRQKLI